jgi:hypothetical protein
MNSLEFLYELSWAKSNPLKLDSFAALIARRSYSRGKTGPCLAQHASESVLAYACVKSNPT